MALSIVNIYFNVVIATINGYRVLSNNSVCFEMLMSLQEVISRSLRYLLCSNVVISILLQLE